MKFNVKSIMRLYIHLLPNDLVLPIATQILGISVLKDGVLYPRLIEKNNFHGLCLFLSSGVSKAIMFGACIVMFSLV